MLHPRLSLSALVTPAWTFAQDMAFWKTAGLRHVGLFAPKVAAFGANRVAAALRAEGLSVSSIICGVFTLDDDSAWARERAALAEMIDLAAEVGGAVYAPPGKGRIDSFDMNAALYAEAVAPCIAHAKTCGVTVAFEPSLRAYTSFVHNLRDAIDLADISGAKLVVDVGNCYHERDARQWIGRAGARIAVVQLSDVAIGTVTTPGTGLRDLPGRGELPLDIFVSAAVAAGYAGPFEIEFLGSGAPDERAILESLRHTSEMLYRTL